MLHSDKCMIFNSFLYDRGRAPEDPLGHQDPQGSREGMALMWVDQTPKSFCSPHECAFIVSYSQQIRKTLGPHFKQGSFCMFWFVNWIKNIFSASHFMADV